MWAVVSSSHNVTVAPSFSGEGLLTLFLCFTMGSLLWGTVLHELLQCQSLPWARFFMNCYSVGPSHSVQSFRNFMLLQCGISQGHKFCQQNYSSVGSHRVTASFGHPPIPEWGPPGAVPAAPPAALALVPTEFFLSHILTPFSWLQLPCTDFFPASLHIAEV